LRGGVAQRAFLNIHLHCLVLDGVYCCGADGVPAFVELGAPTDDELHALLQTIMARLMKLLTRRGGLSRIRRLVRTMPPAPETVGSGPRLWSALGVACLRHAWHQGEP
jgi:hypothetical protein